MPGFSELIMLSERLRDELFQARGARFGVQRAGARGLEGEAQLHGVRRG